MSAKRFRIAFSFAGEKRDYVSKVAAILAKQFGEAAILYDKFHEAEFANADLAFDLPNLYKCASDLIVAVFCPDYEHKEWCGLEWRAIFSIIKEGGVKQIMLNRFQHMEGKGLHGLAGFIELDHKTPEQFARAVRHPHPRTPRPQRRPPQGPLHQACLRRRPRPQDRHPPQPPYPPALLWPRGRVEEDRRRP
jgi:hypothetical protein